MDRPPATATEDDDVRPVFDTFIDAFNALDLPRFSALLGSDVSLFPPEPAGGCLIAGKAAVVAHFERVFAAEAPQGPGIRPVDVHLWSSTRSDVALVAFRFRRRDGSFGRRSITLARGDGRWQVVHLHASNAAAGESTP